MLSRQFRVIDGDGHVHEDENEVSDFLEAPYTGRRSTYHLVPSLDGQVRNPRGSIFTSARVWGELMDATGMEQAVVYTTLGLSLGLMRQADFACAVARAYNNWLYETHLKPEPRLKGVALLPVQDVAESAKELERCVRELGMVGGMMTSVTWSRTPFGDAGFDPLYAAAERLDVPLGIHGAPQNGLGLEVMPRFVDAHTLSHPVPIFTHFTNMIYGGVYHRFPNLRVIYLEAGAGWLPYLMDRMDYEVEAFASEWPYTERPSDVVRRGNIFVTFEGSEWLLPVVANRIGATQILYASDFPHELGPDHATYIHDLEEFAEREDLGAETKQLLLAENAERLYRLKARTFAPVAPA